MRRTHVARPVWVATIVMMVAVPAMATEYVPTWFGQEGTTYQKWTFDDNTNNPVLPDESNNPYGLAEGYITPEGGMNWLPGYGGETGVWPFSGSGDWWIPNYDPVWWKWIYIGGRWRPTPPGPVEPWIPEPVFEIQLDGGVFEPYDATLVQNEDLGNGWYDVAFLLEVDSPTAFSSETIRFGGDIYVDTVRIDTLPEPTTVSLLALGGLALMRRRR